MVASQVSDTKLSSRTRRTRARMLGVNHQVRRLVMRSRSPVITDSDSDSSSWVTDDEVDAAPWTTDDEVDAASWITDDAADWTTDDEANGIAEHDAAAETAAASTTIRGGTLSATRPAALVEPPTSNTARRLSYMSAPLLILAPLLLRRCADQPAMSVVSRFSLLLSSHHFFCIVSLSETMGVLTVFRLVSHLPLLAFSVTRMLSPFAGMTVLYLNTICTAGLCGFALAERRQRAGGEKPAAAVQTNGNKSDPAAPAKLVSFISLVCAVRVLWMCFSFRPGDAVAAVFELSFMAIGCLFSWTLFVEEYLLRGALFPSGHTLGMIGTAGTMFLYMMVFTLAVLFNEAVAAIVPWLAAMATGGLLGYALTVYQQCKQLHPASR